MHFPITIYIKEIENGKGKSMKCGLMEKENQGNVVLWKRKINEMWSYGKGKSRKCGLC
jgi:hypothetical protein